MRGWIIILRKKAIRGADTQLLLSFQKPIKKASILMFSLDGATSLYLRAPYTLFNFSGDLCIVRF